MWSGNCGQGHLRRDYVFILHVISNFQGSKCSEFVGEALLSSFLLQILPYLRLAVNTVQRTLVEAWSLIRETFVDPTFNHQDWDSKLQQTMVEIFPLRSADATYNKVSGILASLGDPFTRIISPKEYQSFRIGSDGNLQGVGLFLSAKPNSGQLASGFGRIEIWTWELQLHPRFGEDEPFTREDLDHIRNLWAKHLLEDCM